MIIAMTLSMSGGRYDDRQWLGPGVPFEVPDWEGEGLVADHNAVDLTGKVTREELAPHQRLPGGERVAVPAPVSLPAETAAGPVTPPPEPEPELPSEPEPSEPPSQADPKQAWIDWAVSRGADEAAAAGMTKADLMSRYGGRL